MTQHYKTDTWKCCRDEAAHVSSRDGCRQRFLENLIENPILRVLRDGGGVDAHVADRYDLELLLHPTQVYRHDTIVHDFLRLPEQQTFRALVPDYRLTTAFEMLSGDNEKQQK